MLKRPHVDEFLQRMGELFECVLFTASLAKVCSSIHPLTVLVTGLLAGFSMDNYFHTWYYLNIFPFFSASLSDSVYFCLLVCG